MNEEILQAIENLKDSVLSRLNTLELAVTLAIPKTRINKNPEVLTTTPENLMRQRIDEVIRLLDYNVTLSFVTRANHHYPSYLLESGDEPKTLAMPFSVLVNRCQQRKIFKTVLGHNERSSKLNAEKAIRAAAAQGHLVVLAAKDCGFTRGTNHTPVTSDTLVVFSPKSPILPQKYSKPWLQPKTPSYEKDFSHREEDERIPLKKSL